MTPKPPRRTRDGGLSETNFTGRRNPARSSQPTGRRIISPAAMPLGGRPVRNTRRKSLLRPSFTGAPDHRYFTHTTVAGESVSRDRPRRGAGRHSVHSLWPIVDRPKNSSPVGHSHSPGLLSFAFGGRRMGSTARSDPFRSGVGI